MFDKPSLLLRAEAAALFFAALYLYHSMGRGWGFFFLLFLWPDLFMLGYLRNVRLGASLYNLAHTISFPIALGAISYGLHQNRFLPFSLIWLAHIALDRALGFGLKYPTTFKDTHLQRLG